MRKVSAAGMFIAAITATPTPPRLRTMPRETLSVRRWIVRVQLRQDTLS